MGLAGIGKSTAARRSVSAHLATLGDLAHYDAVDKDFVLLMVKEDSVCNYRIGE
jgi:hypothetical protein